MAQFQLTDVMLEPASKSPTYLELVPRLHSTLKLPLQLVNTSQVTIPHSSRAIAHRPGKSLLYLWESLVEVGQRRQVPG